MAVPFCPRSNFPESGRDLPPVSSKPGQSLTLKGETADNPKNGYEYKGAIMIGLMSALDEELVRFRDKLDSSRTERHTGIEFYLGSMAGQDVVLLKCGVGKVNAAVATQILIDKYGVDKIIFTGLAGSLVPQLKRGDVVISNFVVQHDVDLTAFGRRPGQLGDTLRMIEADPKLIHAAADAFESALPPSDDSPRQMVVGTIATGDSFVSDPDKIRWLQREFGAVATEMEGAAVGQVCQMNRVPFVIIRVVSDGAGGGAAGEFIMFLDEASEVSFKLVDALLTALGDPAGSTSAR